jgi:hypothetical protein
MHYGTQELLSKSLTQIPGHCLIVLSTGSAQSLFGDSRCQQQHVTQQMAMSLQGALHITAEMYDSIAGSQALGQVLMASYIADSVLQVFIFFILSPSTWLQEASFFNPQCTYKFTNA